jgi:hypothetical protein
MMIKANLVSYVTDQPCLVADDGYRWRRGRRNVEDEIGAWPLPTSLVLPLITRKMRTLINKRRPPVLPERVVSDIFVSYTNLNRDWAFWIAHELSVLGHSVHVADWEIAAGGDIMKWMDEKLGAADHVLCVVSEAYLNAPYASWERRAAQWAANTDRPNLVLPVFIEKCQAPLLLAQLKRCELYGATEQEARARLKLFLAPLPTKPPIGIYPGEKGASERDISPAPRSFPGKIDVEQKNEWDTRNTIWYACLASVMSLLSIQTVAMQLLNPKFIGLWTLMAQFPGRFITYYVVPSSISAIVATIAIRHTRDIFAVPILLGACFPYALLTGALLYKDQGGPMAVGWLILWSVFWSIGFTCFYFLGGRLFRGPQLSLRLKDDQ